MSTRKKVASTPGAQTAGAPSAPSRPQRSAEYAAALASFATAVELLRAGDHARAKEAFETLAAQHRSEPALAERCRAYASICGRRLAPPPAEPPTAEGRYHRAVFLLNEGRWDEAIRLLDRNLAEEPTSVRSLYARSSARALKGELEPALTDLRQAIAVDPQVRFQAANDPDFERIREEPGFIDIIEPTPAGA